MPVPRAEAETDHNLVGMNIYLQLKRVDREKKL